MGDTIRFVVAVGREWAEMVLRKASRIWKMSIYYDEGMSDEEIKRELKELIRVLFHEIVNDLIGRDEGGTGAQGSC